MNKQEQYECLINSYEDLANYGTPKLRAYYKKLVKKLKTKKMNEFILKDTLLGFIDCENLIRKYKKTIDTYVYNWIINHYKLYDYHLETKEQIGRAYIGPNPNFTNEPDECNSEWGWHWHLTPDMKSIRIEFNTIKNQWLDIDDENVVTFTLEEFINQFA